MENSIVRVEHLSHRYNTQWAIRDINFEITQNGVYGLLGSNGAGKSTTMNIMCGVLKQTEGEVYIKGIDLKEKTVEAKKHVGFLPQKAPLYMDLTVEEYLRLCANVRLMPVKDIKQAIGLSMERCGISHFRKRLIRNLSGGYQQRVGIAQAIIHNPDFIVLDEPTNGLDPNQILEVRYLIKELAKECAIILSTHILSEVQATCEYIWMIENGSMVFNGTVADFDNYITPNAICVRLLANPAIEEIKTIPGIIDAQELGDARFRVSFPNVAEAVEQIVEISVARGWRLAEIYPEKSSLNTIFAELSKK